MILLNNNPEFIYTVNSDMLLDYKKTCDLYLADIRHNLTKQLLDYRIYCSLQKVYNAFGVIVDNLIKKQYTEEQELETDISTFVKESNTFTKNIKSLISEEMYETVCQDLKDTQLVLQKFSYILQNLCVSGGETR